MLYESIALPAELRRRGLVLLGFCNHRKVANRQGDPERYLPPSVGPKLTVSDRFLVGGIGNYTSGIEGHPSGPGIAEVYFDDLMVSTVRRGIA